MSVIIGTQPIKKKTMYYKYYTAFYPQICANPLKNAEKLYYNSCNVLQVLQFATIDVLQLLQVLPVIHFQAKENRR